MIGWYTYWREQEVCLRGHSNAMIVARVDHSDGRNLARTFDGAFAKLWEPAVSLSEYRGVSRSGAAG